MTDTLRNSLAPNEKPMYDAFVRTEGREPESMWQLMHYSAGLQQINAKEHKFWGGII